MKKSTIFCLQGKGFDDWSWSFTDRLEENQKINNIRDWWCSTAVGMRRSDSRLRYIFLNICYNVCFPGEKIKKCIWMQPISHPKSLLSDTISSPFHRYGYIYWILLDNVSICRKCKLMHEMTNISIKTQTVLRTEIWTSPYLALICTCACATFSHMHSI